MEFSPGNSSGYQRRRMWGRGTLRYRMTTRLLCYLLEVKVARSSYGKSLCEREDIVSVRTEYHYTISHAPVECHSCSGQGEDWGTSHSHPRGRIYTSSKTQPKSISSPVWPTSLPYKGAGPLPNRGMDRQCSEPGRVATTDLDHTCTVRGSNQS